MPDSQSTRHGAVFLSYASQDAGPAKRICEALQSSGVVVWFDQSELRGGDAWDQSIRRQIKNCALFVPVISAHTQTRLEGYFRLEWKLAEDRSHLMAKGTPFILPVAIDATSDHDARVPDSFLSVQWTRLPGGETPTAFCDRVNKLLGEPDLEPGNANPGRESPIHALRPSRPARRWLVPAVVCVLAAAALSLWRPWRNDQKPAEAVPAAAPESEAQKLVAKAWAELNKTELGPDELGVADGLCRRATELDPSDPDGWAAWSQVDSWYIYHNFDTSAGRQDGARQCAAHALQLAPDSYEARLAQACYLVRGATVGTGRGEVSTFAAEASQLLHKLLEERRSEPRALFALGILQRNLGHLDEARASFIHLADNPRYAATAWSEIAWAEYRSGSFSGLEEPLARSLAIQPFWGNLVLKATVSMDWVGDLDAAKAALDKLPVTVLQSDIGVSMTFTIRNYERKPDEWLKFSRGIRRDWIHSNTGSGPVAAYNGLAQRMAGRNQAAHIEWQTALGLVERALADQPADAGLLRWKGDLLIYLGDNVEAEKALNQAGELSGYRPVYLDLRLRIAKGQLDAALDLLESSNYYTAAELRLDPDFDPLRSSPRFKALLVRAEADPSKAPQPSKENAPVHSPAITRS